MAKQPEHAEISLHGLVYKLNSESATLLSLLVMHEEYSPYERGQEYWQVVSETQFLGGYEMGVLTQNKLVKQL